MAPKHVPSPDAQLAADATKEAANLASSKNAEAQIEAAKITSKSNRTAALITGFSWIFAEILAGIVGYWVGKQQFSDKCSQATSTSNPTSSQISKPPTETPYPSPLANIPILTPSASPTPPIYAITNCIDYHYWTFSVTSVPAPRDSNHPDCLSLDNWRFYTGVRSLPDSPSGLGIIGPLSSGVTIGIVHSVNQSEIISLDVYLKSLSYSSEDCMGREICDINLVVGIGSPIEYNGAFVVFRAHKDSPGVKVCLLDSIFSTCNSSVFPPDENIISYRLIFTINDRQVFIQFGEGTQQYPFLLGVNQTATLWLGYNTRVNGKIDAYITFPP